MYKLVGIIGSNSATLNDTQAYDFAFELGKSLKSAGFKIVCGGKYGVMEAVAKGMKSVGSEKSVDVVCIIPDENPDAANTFCDIVIPTGMGVARNVLIVRTADILIAIAGGAGTLSEMALAWQFGKKVLCVTQFSGWAKELAGRDLDFRYRGLFVPVASVEEIMRFLQQEI